MIVLDTHAWVWWVSGSEQISRAARDEIELAIEGHEVFISSISCWEISLLIRKGRLALALSVDDWVARSEALPFVQFAPVDNRIALRSNQLPGDPPEDPADRIIIATALTLGAPLVSRDKQIRDYPFVQTIW